MSEADMDRLGVDADLAYLDLSHATIERLAVRIGAHHAQLHQAEYVPFFGIGVGTTVLYSGACQMIGWVIGGSGIQQQATVNDGPDTSRLTLPVALPINANYAYATWAPVGILFHAGISLTAVNGTWTGGIFYRPLGRG